jgi:hypothetical protein
LTDDERFEFIWLQLDWITGLSVWIIIALARAAQVGQSAPAVPPDVQGKLGRIDRAFVCPESLPTIEAKTNALKLFIQEVSEADPQVTLGDMLAFRYHMLEKHNCTITLAHIREGDKNEQH